MRSWHFLNAIIERVRKKAKRLVPLMVSSGQLIAP
jgi:hypothetical protein